MYNDNREVAEKTISTLGQKGGDASDFEKTLSDISMAWSSNVQKIEIRTDVAKFRGPMEEGLKKIVLEINLILVDEGSEETPNKFTASEDAAEDKKQQAQYDKTKASAARAFRWLQDEGVDVGPLAGEWNAIKDDDGSGINLTQALLTLADVEHRLREAVETQRQARQKATEEGMKAVKLLRERLKKLAKKHGDYASFFDSLGDQITDCEGMIASSVLAIVQTGTNKLNEVNGELDRLERANGAQAQDDDKSFQMVEKALGAISTTIKDAALGTCLETKQKVFKHRLKNEVTSDVRKLAPKDALNGYTATNPGEDNAKKSYIVDQPLYTFNSEVDAAIKTARERKKKRDDISREATRIKTMVDEGLTQAPKMIASLQSQIDAASKPGENEEDHSLLVLQRIASVVVEAMKSPAMLDSLEQQVARQELDAEQERLKWEARLDIFDKNEARKAKEAYDSTEKKDRAIKLYERIGTLRKQAEELAQKNKAYKDAISRLLEASYQAEEFIANPYGHKTTSRKKLTKASDLWKRAVGTLVRDVNNLKGVIAGDVTEYNQLHGDDPITLADIEKPLRHLARSFDANRFDKWIEGLESDATSLRDTRAIKEMALRYIRHYQRIAATDPVMPLPKSTPFGVNLNYSDLENQLKNLDLNFQRF